MMKKLLVIFFLLTAELVFAQKVALVIGNGNYTSISKLNNPVNDANAMEEVLRQLGFNVTKVVDGTQSQMYRAIINFKQSLGASRNTYGFFFYAGHGVQSGGENYLIPVDANIQSENLLDFKAVSVSYLLGELSAAGNELNVIVLDACRDNPFDWVRGSSRGLAVVSNAPAGSIIAYAAMAGSAVTDGNNMNSQFTASLIKNLKLNLEVHDIFLKTRNDVTRVSDNRQRPEINFHYNNMAYLGLQPLNYPPPAASPASPAGRTAQTRPQPVTTAAPAARPEASMLTRLSRIQRYNLDQGIREAADVLISSLRRNSKVVVIHIFSPDKVTSDYIRDELTASLISARLVSVIDKRFVDVIKGLENFQDSGDASDVSLVRIGQSLKADYVITGDVTESSRNVLNVIVTDVQNGTQLAPIRKEF